MSGADVATVDAGAGHQAILVRIVPRTEKHPTRMVASCDAGKITVTWNHDHYTGENAAIACRHLLAKLGWGGTWRGGRVPETESVLFVRIA